MPPKFNVDAGDTKFMTALASRWWDKKGVWKSLHDMNGIRVRYVIEGLIKTGKLNSDCLNSPDALKGINILDVG